MKLKFYIKDILLNDIAQFCITPPYCRRLIFKLLGYKINKKSIVYPKFFCGYGKGKLIINEGSYTNYGCFFDLGADITIGKNVAVGMNVTFINSTHEIGGDTKRASKSYAMPIIIEDGCWIGANAVIMPNVKIAKGCIIAANALVTKDTEPNGLYMGQPARRIKDL